MTPRATSPSGTPIGTTLTRPASSSPGAVTRPRLSPANARVSAARMAGPAGAPPSADIPEGMSRATTGRPLALISSIARATLPSGEPREPVPRSASTTTWARASALAAPSARRRGRIPLRRISSSLSRASPPISAGGNASSTDGRAPRRLSHRATTNPSPPLPPLPQTTTTRAPRRGAPSSGSAAMIDSAAPRPAFSIRVAPGMPSSAIACRSSRRISSAVKTLRTAFTPRVGAGTPGRESRRGPRCKFPATPCVRPWEARCAAPSAGA